MGLADERELVPLGTGFDIVRRGYSRTQVEEHLERLDSDLRLIAADRDAALSQAADLAHELELARAEIDQLNEQIDRLAEPPTSPKGLSLRLQRMLRHAQDEAAEIKARAAEEAGHIRASAESDANVLRGHYEQMIAALEDRRAEMEREHLDLLTKAEAEIEQRAIQAEEVRRRADAEAAERRNQIDEDFEIAMSARRTKAMRALAEQEASSKAEAERRIRESTEEAARIDSEIQARDAISKAEAERLIADATKKAHQKLDEATEEANRRINAVATKLDALYRVRSQVAGQLQSSLGILSECLHGLDAVPEESSTT